MIDDDFATTLDLVLSSAPVAAFQLRLKPLGEDALGEDAIAQLAPPLQQICAAHDTAFIVNDSVTLAQRLRADGVHLGQNDGEVREARRRLGPQAQIGVTCHNSRHLAMQAGEEGADYVAFGAFFPTTTKNVEHWAESEILTWWQTFCEVSCVAIGGVTAENARSLAAAGADFVAVSSAVWQYPLGPAAGVAALSEALA